MRQAQTFDFLFKNVEKQFESYQGINVKLRCELPVHDACVSMELTLRDIIVIGISSK